MVMNLLTKSVLVGRDANCMMPQLSAKYYKTMYEDEVISNIREAISHKPDIKIWNMSIGTNLTADEQEFSDYAKELDSIQDEFDVLIVKSAGNCENLPVPVSRIAYTSRFS